MLAATLYEISPVAIPAYPSTSAKVQASHPATQKSLGLVGPHGKAHELGMRLFASCVSFGTVPGDVQGLASRLQRDCAECRRAGHALLWNRVQRARIRLSLLQAPAA